MSAGVGIREYPWRWRGGGGGGLNKFFYGEAGSRGPTPYLIKKTIFDRKGSPFLYFLLASIDK